MREDACVVCVLSQLRQGVRCALSLQGRREQLSGISDDQGLCNIYLLGEPDLSMRNMTSLGKARASLLHASSRL